MENKSFQIDSNIILNKKRNNKSINKNTNSKKEKKSSKNNLLIVFLSIILLLIGFIFWIKKNNEIVIKDFLAGQIIVCKDRLVSKELGYIFNKNENAFINKKEGLFFSIYYCSDYDK